MLRATREQTGDRNDNKEHGVQEESGNSPRSRRISDGKQKVVVGTDCNRNVARWSVDCSGWHRGRAVHIHTLLAILSGPEADTATHLHGGESLKCGITCRAAMAIGSLPLRTLLPLGRSS